MINNYLINEKTDEELIRNHNNFYYNVHNGRNNRYSAAYKNYIESANFNVIPKTLSELQDRLNRLTNLHLNGNYYSSVDIEAKIQEIQSKIDNNDYCVEGTPEWTTRQEFLAYAANFQWPNANELLIRQQEEAELLALLN